MTAVVPWCRGDDGRGAAHVGADQQPGRGHVAGAALRQHPALGGSAGEGSGAQHQKEQEAEQERRGVPSVTDRCVQITKEFNLVGYNVSYFRL